MAERLAKQIKEIAGQSDLPVAVKFIERVESDSDLTRDEDPNTHFCVFFAAYDPKEKQIFVGHHKKSGLWLFNGGHIDHEETLENALEREIDEEWGLEMSANLIGAPQLLTITEIDNPTKQACTRHYDIWYFVPVSKDDFSPRKELLATEFHTNSWLKPNDARNIITDPSTLEAITTIERMFS